VMTDKKNKKTHIVKSIHSMLCSESKKAIVDILFDLV